MKKLFRLQAIVPVTISLCLFFLVPALSFAQAPANDLCANAITLTSANSCTNTVGTMNNASFTAIGDPGPAPCGGGIKYDVWYKFVAQSTNPTITLSNIGINFAGPLIQILSGGCGGLAVLSCGASPLIGAGLTIGTTYYIRVFSTTTGIPAVNGGFNICITEKYARVEYSKSYINITKGLNGGTIDPGDTLEIRATFVVFSNSVDSVAFYDTLYNTRGLKLVPGSIATRTNEGKIYKAFTDNFDADGGGWRFASGLDTVIRINMGYGATATQYARGKIRNNSKPSNFGNTCIIMATYRAVVYAGYNTKIDFGNGVFTYRDTITSILRTVSFNTDSLIVYQSPGLCPNATSVLNAIGVESNGTFGTAPAGINFARNRAPSIYTGYTYNTFIPGGGPQDYYYGIANNTSAQYSTLTTWPKPDGSAPSHRIFAVWDISGDHTGAVNTAKGNPPCDTTKVVSATNPCGYMLVINSAFKTDTAFQYTVTNLCPNTNYEIAAWIKNICSKCACDSNGVGPSTGGYIPSGPGDTSGVQPNLAYAVDGIDYYTTGNIRNSGVSYLGSDTTNQWYKKGFTYLTGPAQTSFTLTLRNNAPGGGGNDWAIDDIAVNTCLPNMKYSPSVNPTVCMFNPMTINDTVQSYFSNYTNFKWQRSTDNGVTWTDEIGAGASGNATVSPVPPAPGPYQYVLSYTIPAIHTAPADSGDLYRVMVATTAPNLANGNCQATDGSSVINLKIIDCGYVLKTDLLSFNGKLVNDLANLSWTTSKEDEPIDFNIERSTDGTNFTVVGTVSSNNNNTVFVNHYSFIDPLSVKGKVQYRIVLTNRAGREKRSNVIQLSIDEIPDFALENVINPFANELEFNIVTSKNTSIDVQLIDAYGKIVKKYSYMVYAGVNNLSLRETAKLSSGMYIFRILHNEKVIYRNVLKL